MFTVIFFMLLLSSMSCRNIFCWRYQNENNWLLHLRQKKAPISTEILIIHKIYIITFNMNPKNLFVTSNGVFFITNGLNTDATWKLSSISYLCLSFGKQLARSLQVTGFKSCFSYGVCFVYIKRNNYFLN